MPREEVRYGSQGEGVRDLQKYLNQIGGGKYYLKEDGIFGVDTLNVVRDFQKNNGLTVDGIVGYNTWAALTDAYTGANTANTANNTTTSNEAFEYDDFTYKDFKYNKYQESDTVKDAEAALNAQLSQKPGEYKSQWQAQLDDTINKILNREKFSYDLNGDALYQQYKDKYIKQGKMAMGDAIGQASAMTGGYGNSYAQSVGQQAYQAQLENLNDIVPELYQMAYDKYNQEGQDLYNQYSMLGAQEEQDYGRYRDSVADWQSERDYLAGRYDSEREFDYSKYDNERGFAYGQYADDRNFAYGQYSDDRNLAYTEYRNAIEDALAKEQFEYQKSRDVIEDEQWQKQFNAMYGNNSTGGSSGGSGSGTGSGGNNNTGGSYNNGSLSSSQIKALQKALGVEADGMYGSASQKAAGGLSAEEAYKKFVDGQGGGGNGFTGKTYNEATAFMESHGVPGGNVAGLMTASEWNRRKSSYQAFGTGSSEVKNYKTYQEYLADYVEYAIEKYGK